MRVSNCNSNKNQFPQFVLRRIRPHLRARAGMNRLVDEAFFFSRAWISKPDDRRARVRSDKRHLRAINPCAAFSELGNNRPLSADEDWRVCPSFSRRACRIRHAPRSINMSPGAGTPPRQNNSTTILTCLLIPSYQVRPDQCRSGFRLPDLSVRSFLATALPWRHQ